MDVSASYVIIWAGGLKRRCVFGQEWAPDARHGPQVRPGGVTALVRSPLASRLTGDSGHRKQHSPHEVRAPGQYHHSWLAALLGQSPASLWCRIEVDARNLTDVVMFPRSLQGRLQSTDCTSAG